MANDLLNPTEADTAARLASRNGHPASMQFGAGLATETGHELDALLGKAFEEKSVWADLYDNLHELFFPTKLPPLELTSTPIPVPDPMAVKRSPAAVAISTLVNGGILALLLFAFRGTIIKATNQMHLTNLDPNISPWKPTTKNNGNIGGGGGGGSHDIVDPIKGRLPPRQKDPLLQPQVAVNPDPKLVLQPAIDVQKEIKLPDNPNLPNLGVTNSVNVQLASNGQGQNGGMGTGSKGGIGSGSGNGFGPGYDGNTGGGLRKIGDGVSPPTVIYKVEAEFSDEARRAKYEGAVVLSLIVDAQGNPQNIRVSRALGMGLDEKAIEAARQYKFKPAIDKKTGKGVPVEIALEVNFRIY